MEILLMRHGTKIDDQDRHIDTLGLSKVGQEEVRMTAKHLTAYLHKHYPDISPDEIAIYYSPLERADETAKLLQQYSHSALQNCDCIKADFLKEKHKGLGYDYTKNELRALYPSLMERLYDAHSDSLAGRITRTMPGVGAESILDLMAKRGTAIDDAVHASEHAKKKLVIMIGHSCSTQAVVGKLCFDSNIQNMAHTFLEDTWNIKPTSIMKVHGDAEHGFAYDGYINFAREVAIARA